MKAKGKKTGRKKAAVVESGYKPPSRKERMRSAAEMAASDVVSSHPQVTRMKKSMASQILKAMSGSSKGIRGARASAR